MAKTKQKKTKAMRNYARSDSTNVTSGKAEAELCLNKINTFLMIPAKTLATKSKQHQKRAERTVEKDKQIVTKAFQVIPNKNSMSSCKSQISSRQQRQESAEKLVVFSSTLPNPKRGGKPDLKPGYQTLDYRSLSKDEAESNFLSNKRVLQLKTGVKTSIAKPIPSRSPELPRRQQYSQNQTQTKQDLQGAAQSIEVKMQHLHPSVASSYENPRIPSPLISSRVEDIKIYRSSSISKRSDATKKKRKLKNILKKHKKAKEGKQTTLLGGDLATSNVVVRKPRGSIVIRLQNEIEETKELFRRSALELIEERNSQLNFLMDKTEILEQSSLKFATTARDTRLKENARTTCCGIGSKWKICWYICACERGVKQKKKTGKIAKEPENDQLLSSRATVDLDDDAQPYGFATLPVTPTVRPPSEEISRPSSKACSMDDKIQQTGTLGNKLSKMAQKIKGSMPNLARHPPSETGSLSSMGALEAKDRMSHSMTALHEIVKKRREKKREEHEKKEKEQKEKEIQQFVAEHYEDEQLRKRAASLLRID